MGSVYVLLAWEDGRLKECVVLSDSNQAFALYQKMGGLYGWSNVALASRSVDAVPENLQ